MDISALFWDSPGLLARLLLKSSVNGPPNLRHHQLILHLAVCHSLFLNPNCSHQPLCARTFAGSSVWKVKSSYVANSPFAVWSMLPLASLATFPPHILTDSNRACQQFSHSFNRYLLRSCLMLLPSSLPCLELDKLFHASRSPLLERLFLTLFLANYPLFSQTQFKHYLAWKFLLWSAVILLHLTINVHSRFKYIVYLCLTTG